MSVSALTWAFAQEIRPATHKFVLVALAHCCNELEDPWQAWPSATDLKKKTGLERRVIFYALKDLKNQGLINPTGEFKGSKRQIPVYQLHGCITCTGANGARVHKTTRTGANGASPPSSLPLHPLSTPPSGNKKEQEVDRLDFIDQLRPLYPGIDIDSEVRKLRAWLLTPRGQGKKLTRQRLVNWMNRCDSPIEIVQRKKPDPLAGLTAEEKAAGGFYE